LPTAGMGPTHGKQGVSSRRSAATGTRLGVREQHVRAEEHARRVALGGRGWRAREQAREQARDVAAGARAGARAARRTRGDRPRGPRRRRQPLLQPPQQCLRGLQRARRLQRGREALEAVVLALRAPGASGRASPAWPVLQQPDPQHDLDARSLPPW